MEARIVERHYQQLGVNAELYSLADVPPELYSPEAYKTKPAAFVEVQQKILDAAGMHIVVPEYNGSFPGVLKVFIDHLPFPQSFEGKPVCFIGLAAGMWGGLRAVEHLRLSVGRLAVRIGRGGVVRGLPAPVASSGGAVSVSIAFYVPDGDRFRSTDWTRGPWDPRQQHAGPPTALLGRAIEGLEGSERFTVARLSVELLRSVPLDRRDEPEAVAAPAAPRELRPTLGRDDPTTDAVVDTMTEEELLRGLERLSPEEPSSKSEGVPLGPRGY